MKKLLKIIGGFFAGLLILIVVAALVLPSMILNRYEDKIITMIGEQTGRDIKLGDMSLRILPSPQLQIKNVSVPSVEGAAEAEFASMDSFRINIAILPLLTKIVKIKTIELINANVVAEILPDGSNNWTFAPKKQVSDNVETNKIEGRASGDNSGSNFNIVINDIRLQNGEVIYINRMPDARQLLSVSDVNVTAAMQSFTGPFKAKGDLNWNGKKFNIDLKTGQLEGKKPSQFDVKVGIGKDHNFAFDGIATIKPNILLNGRVNAESVNPSALVKELGLNINGLPAAEVKLSGNIETSETVGKAEKIRISIDKSSLDASLDWSLGDINSINAILRGKTVNMDQILASLTPSTDINTAQTIQTSSTSKPQQKAAMRLPDNLNIDLDAQIQRLIYNQKDISNLKLLAQMKEGRLDISDVSAVLPGSSPIGASVSITNGEKSPIVDGNFNFTSERLKDLVAWVGGDVDSIPDGRFKSLNIRSNLAGSLEKITLSDISGQIDESKIQGSASIATVGRMRAAADIKIDQIQLDPWLAAFSQTKPIKTSMGNIVVSKAYAAETKTALVPLDLDLKLAIANLFYQGMKISGIGTDLSILNDNLTLRSANINDLVGAQINAVGYINDLGGAQVAKDLKINLKASSLAAILKLANVDIGVPAEKIGTVSSDIMLNGSLKNNITISAALQALGGSYGAKGQVNPSNIVINGLDFVIKHNNLNQLMAVFSPDTKIPKGMQSVDFKGRAEINGKKYGLSKLSGKIGSSNIKSGTLTADLSQAKPYLAANIAAGTLNIDALLEEETQKTQKQKQTQAAQRKAGTPPWTDDIIDFSPLNLANTDVAITADKIIMGGKSLTSVQLKETLKDGLMNISNLSANAYGGKLQLSAKVDGRSGGAISSNVNIQGLNLNALAKDMAGIKLPIGKLNLTTDVSMAGNTSRKLVSSLNGNGTIKIAGLGAQATGSEFDAFLGILQRVGSISGSGILDVNGQFKAQNGIVNINPLKISGPIGGNAAGHINLAKWTLDIAGAFTLLDGGVSKLVLATLNKQDQSESHKFRIYGSIDKPNMDLPSDLQKALNLYKGVSEGDIKSLIAGGVNDKLLQKLGLSGKDSSTVQGLIDVFGGGSSSKGNNQAAQDILNNIVGGNDKQKSSNNNTSNNDPVGNIINEQVDKALGDSDNPLNDTAKQLLNDGANELLKGLFN